MYSISGFGAMMVDSVRMDAYVAALRAAVRPGSVVLDIGTGTGVFALLACQFGARRVYAVEPGDAIELARQLASANGYSDRIEFHQAMSTEIDLAEKADVIISDLRGVLPVYGSHIPSIIDARRRFLAPGGALIPQRDQLVAAIVEADEPYRGVTRPWSEQPFGLDMGAAIRLLSNVWVRINIAPEKMLTNPVVLGEIDYTRVEDASFSASATLTCSRPGLAHGVCVWFDATLAEGIGFSNAPGLKETIYGKAFFPFTSPVRLEAGDSIELSLKASASDPEYHWSWRTRILGPGGPAEVKAAFSQSSLFGEPHSVASLRKRAADHVPELGGEGKIDAEALALMSEQLSLGDIARTLMARNPGRFRRWEDALNRVAELSSKYSK